MPCRSSPRVHLSLSLQQLVAFLDRGRWEGLGGIFGARPSRTSKTQNLRRARKTKVSRASGRRHLKSRFLPPNSPKDNGK